MRKSLQVVLMITFLGSGCTSAPRTPPTWLLAFNEGGAGQPSDPKTIESMDGTAWVLKRPALSGPAAHDGRFTWKQVSVARHLLYRDGVGGVASATEGIIWSQSTQTGVTNVLAEKRPGCAFGNSNWVVVFRGQGTDRNIYLSQQAASGGSWSSRLSVNPAGGLAETERSPALASGAVNGQGTFVLVYIDSNNQAVASKSTDLTTWSPPAAIGEAWKDPAITYKDGRFYALVSRPVGNDNRYFLYKSADAVSWIEIGSYIYNPPPGSAASLYPPTHPERNRHGPTLAANRCKVVVVEAAVHGHLQGREGAVYQPCDDPTTVVFSGDQPVRLLTDPNQNLVWNGPVALTFGEGE